MKKAEMLLDVAASIFDLSAEYAKERRRAAMNRLIDPETGKARVSRETTLRGAFDAVGKHLTSAVEQY